MKKVLLLLPFLTILISGNIQSQTCQDASVQLSAVVQASPPRITLNWIVSATTTQYVVYRKLKTATAWGSALDTLPGTATQFTDSTVAVATSYEYKITRTGVGYTGYGYINSGIEIPLTEQRGILILIADSTFVDSLSMEIRRLQSDLEGDGWKVIRHNVSRTASVPSVKALIVHDYNLDQSNTKALFLFGHVPVPYSGNLNPDGHPDHLGAWPADVYYGVMSGIWYDSNINDTVASNHRNWNVPGDGKFDATYLPGDVQLQTGRVDLSNMPSFSASETQLLRNYLNKDHAYRHKVFTAVRRAVIDDNFGYFSTEAFAASGWKNLSPLVGKDSVGANDYFTSMTGKSYLWSYGCGGGWYSGAGGIGSTTDFASSNLQGVFTMLFGSYFGDWDSQDNFLRAPLAQGKTLTNCWSGRPHWVFHHMGLGENIGYDTRISQNNSSLYFNNYGARMVHIALMGDPTLRNDIVAPVSNVVATVAGNNCNITWTASADTVLGYNIYMKNDSIPGYIRINPNIITDTFYTDHCLMHPGIYTYMVRAILLQHAPSGTYYNPSQGISDTAMNYNNLQVHASATYSINDSVVAFTNTSTNATNYHWAFGDGTLSTQQDPVHNFQNGMFTVILIADNGCDFDTTYIIISVATGIKETATAFIVSVSPNPSAGKFRISFKDATKDHAEIKVYNLTGTLVLNEPVTTNPIEIDLSCLPEGIYILDITKGAEQIRKKLIIQK